jgi:hypothetical protein
MKCAFAVNEALYSEMRLNGFTFSHMGMKAGLTTEQVKEILRDSSSSVQIAMIYEALQELETERKEQKQGETH